MNFIKRAGLSVKARKGKSLLQLIVFTVICVFVLSGLSIQTAAEKSADLARQSLGGEVTLQMDVESMMERQSSEQSGSENGGRVRFASEPIPADSASALAEMSQVKGYNLLSSSTATADDFEPIENESTESVVRQTDEDASEMPEGGMGGGGGGFADADVTLQGVLYTDAASAFLNEEAVLTEGRHLTEADAGQSVAVIEATLAEENDLTVGDAITISSTGDEVVTKELEIVGIYETSSTGDAQGMNFAAMNPYNQIYVPYTLASTYKGETNEGMVDSAIYYLNDPEEIDSFIEEAKATSDLDFEVFKLDANDAAYQQMIGPIENVASFSKNIVYLVTIAGAIILGLIVMLSIRERKYEMGVLLALGERKTKLISQFVVEIVIVAVLALGISAVAGNAVANQFGEQLLSQEVAQSAESAVNPQSFGGGPGGMRGGMPGAQSAEQSVEAIDELAVDVSAQDLGWLAGIGLLIAVLSALLPSLSILRMQPKNILSKQD
ncbi:ABC transporter permease [Planomicrobium sp. CPCC 101079]|uniref:ABC transporter permease n=1 Tax=Planomicrobium sp. CPCC 101079 TaxID=2599618 RepID=UPI0011B537BD|nr:ABC transporter permease [Planomicrobium sp. CPCC 101079]TWT01950.1 ABC transporter permease [Planomicrobium sp. CPCC 101079]